MKNMKYCWLAKEFKRGWKLGLCLGNLDPIWLTATYFIGEQGVKNILKGNIVFVHMKKGVKDNVR